MKQKYLLRFNTKHGETDFYWRIFDENNKEYLVKNFKITVPMHGEESLENNIKKHNVACYGTLTISNDIAYID